MTDMAEIIGFFLAGGALGGMSAWLHNRQPSTFAILAGLYGIAFAVCWIVSHASQLEMMAFIAPYVLVAIAASIWSAGLAIHWPSIVDRVTAWTAAGRNPKAAA
jgi:hypothetical protein